MVYIQRLIEPILQDYIKKESPPFNAILLSGARQCGKSTFLQNLYSPDQHIFINLSKEAGFAEAIDSTSNFDDFTFLIENRFNYKIGGNKVILFDEAQLSKKLGQYVRFMKEIWQTQRVFLTGSTLFHLFDNTQKPTGRVVEFTLRPFNFFEFLNALGKNALLEKLKTWDVAHPFSETIHKEAIECLRQYFIWGGLPEVVMAYKEGGDPMRILSNIFAFYKRDFETKLENLTSIFNQVFLRIAVSTGSSIKFSSIIQSSSPGYKQVKSVLSILEAWHQILKVECEMSELSKTGTITPKRYIFDHGIRFLQNPARFQDVDLLDTTSMTRNEMGGILENFVLTEYLSTNNPINPRCWSKTHQSGSIDFILANLKNEICAIEVKSATKLNTKHFSSFLSYSNFFPKSRLVLANLSRGEIAEQWSKGLLSVIPLYAIYPFLMKG